MSAQNENKSHGRLRIFQTDIQIGCLVSSAQVMSLQIEMAFRYQQLYLRRGIQPRSHLADAPGRESQLKVGLDRHLGSCKGEGFSGGKSAINNATSSRNTGEGNRRRWPLFRCFSAVVDFFDKDPHLAAADVAASRPEIVGQVHFQKLRVP